MREARTACDAQDTTRVNKGGQHDIVDPSSDHGYRISQITETISTAKIEAGQPTSITLMPQSNTRTLQEIIVTFIPGTQHKQSLQNVRCWDYYKGI
jgi:hypothetical protein